MKKRAYTLFELLVSISIIGILIAVASVSYGAAQKKARDARRMEDLNSIQKAAEMYYSQSSSYSYPSSSGGFGTVLQQWPTDPKLTTNYTYQPNVPALGGYCVCALLDGTGGNSSNGICSAFVAGGGAYFCVKNQQ